MRAARLHAYGPPEAFRIEDVEPGPLRPNDVRVRVVAASINPVDAKIRAGSQRGAIRLHLPVTLGLDVSGEVIEVGPKVSDFAVGDLVMGCPDHRRDGSYAEQVVVDAASLAKAPTSIPLEHAAALPLAGQTAWQCLVPRLSQRPGQRVLIQAGSGGVGHLAIPIAKAHGAWVATTCSEKNHAFVEALGADAAIDYRTHQWWEELSDLDVVLDALGYEERDRALAAVARGGQVASIVTGLPVATERWGPNLGVVAVALGILGFTLRGWLQGKSARTVVKRNQRADLDALARMVDDGTLRPHIHASFPLDGIGEAHTLLESHRVVGKVLVVP